MLIYHCEGFGILGLRMRHQWPWKSVRKKRPWCLSWRIQLDFSRRGTIDSCQSTKTQVNPSSALNRIKHHQSNPSNVPGILDSNLSKRACVFSYKSLILGLTGSLPYNRIRSPAGFLPSGFTTSLVCLTSVAHVRGISLCSLERQDSPLL